MADNDITELNVIEDGSLAQAQPLRENFTFLQNQITACNSGLGNKISTGARGAANGVCPLNSSSKVPSNYLDAADTQADNNNSTKIATTAFVKKATDGQWVRISSDNQEVLKEGTSLHHSSGTEITKTLNVPNDGRTYEVLFTGQCNTGESTNNYVILKVGTNKLSYKVNLCGIRTKTNSSVFARGSVILPISYASGNVQIARGEGWNGTGELIAVAYRRMGVNT